MTVGFAEFGPVHSKGSIETCFKVDKMVDLAWLTVWVSWSKSVTYSQGGMYIFDFFGTNFSHGFFGGGFGRACTVMACGVCGSAGRLTWYVIQVILGNCHLGWRMAP